MSNSCVVFRDNNRHIMMKTYKKDGSVLLYDLTKLFGIRKANAIYRIKTNDEILKMFHYLFSHSYDDGM